MDTTETITHIGLCAGYGGIELGLKRVLPTLRTVALCEIEAFACANLVAKMEAGLMDPAPIWSNLKTFPWAEFRDRVDILTGGYPCQPFSAAGKRLGGEDSRHLWPFISAGIAAMRPSLCFFENVEGHISLGLPDVIEDLGRLGYRTTWGIFSAAEVGAPHQRKRVFILAHRNGEGLERYSGLLAGCDESRWNSSGSAGSANGSDHGRDIWPSRPGEPQYAWEPPRVVGNAEGSLSRIEAKRQWRESAGGASEEVVGNAEMSRRSQSRTDELQAGINTSFGDAGSKAGEIGGQGGIQSMGNAEMFDGSRQAGGQRKAQAGRTDTTRDDRQVEPALGGDADGAAGGLDYAELCVSCDNRTDELRLLGNGVVPATSALAFRTLLDELHRG